MCATEDLTDKEKLQVEVYLIWLIDHPEATCWLYKPSSGRGGMQRNVLMEARFDMKFINSIKFI